jgi:hypothetical protein
LEITLHCALGTSDTSPSDGLAFLHNTLAGADAAITAAIIHLMLPVIGAGVRD